MRKTEQKTSKIFQILFEKGIASGTVLDNQNVTIISRRMVRDCEISQIRKEVGRLGGNPGLKKINNNLDKQNPSKSTSLQFHSSASVTKNNPPAPRKRGMEYADDFLTFWKIYPRKVGKDAAWRVWKARNGIRPAVMDLVTAIQKQTQSIQWQKENGQFIPNPATWLNQGRWDDEPIPINGSVAAGERDVREYQSEKRPTETEQQRQENIKRIADFTSKIG